MMCDGDYINQILLDSIDNAKWETAEHDSSRTDEIRSPVLGKGQNSAGCAFDLCDEVGTEAGHFGFISVDRLEELLLCSG